MNTNDLQIKRVQQVKATPVAVGPQAGCVKYGLGGKSPRWVPSPPGSGFFISSKYSELLALLPEHELHSGLLVPTRITHPTEGIGEQVMKAKVTVLGLLAGAAMVVPMTTQEVAAETVLIQGADPQDTARTRVRNGVVQLRATDEEMTNEQPAFAFSPDNKAVGIAIMMSTGTLAGPGGENAGQPRPQNNNSNMQGACMPLELVASDTSNVGVTIARDTANYKYITNRNADDSRAFNNPGVKAIGTYGDKELFIVTAGWDRNNNTNTERYIQVVDQDCNLVQLTGNVNRRENNTSAVIMAKNNDNCSGRQAGGGADVYKDAAGVVHYVSAELCNGNGRDDGWQNYIQVQCNAAGTSCDIDKQSDTSFISREERSRGRCELIDTNADGVPETSFCCGTEGNSQPQREGVWCAGIDNASGQLLYRERIAYRGETEEGLRTYAMRMKMLAEVDESGNKTGAVFLQYQMHRGRNNNNKKGGYDDKVLLAIAKPNAQGTNVQAVADLTQMVIDSRLEVTHANVFQTREGSTGSTSTILNLVAGNHNGNSVSTKVMQVRVNTNTGVVENIGLQTLQAPNDQQKYAKYLGNNPNNQGRDYNDCHATANPLAETDPSQPPMLNICAQTGKMTSPDNPAIKPDLLMEIWTSMQGVTPTPAEPAPGVELPSTDVEGGTNPGNSNTPSTPSTPGSTSPGNSVGGCSVNGGSAGGSAAFVLFGLALALRRRRRS